VNALFFPSPVGGAPVYHCAETSSTIDDAKRLVSGGAAIGTVVWADFQTRGRGRFSDRQWESPRAENLLFTLILSQPTTQSGSAALPLRVGLEVAAVLEEHCGCRPLLKWPNDIMLEGKKTAGILCQIYRERALVSVGVNCNQQTFPPALRERATSLSLCTGREIDRQALLFHLLAALGGLAENDDWRPEAEKRLFGLGQYVSIKETRGNATLVEGELAGLGKQGELLVRPAGSEDIVPVVSGTLVVG